jgi:uncharacterized protein YbjT (DUF2867 family)
MKEPSPVLVTGATGYIGSRLIPRLAGQGYRVRAFGRSMEKMAQRHWACLPEVELFQGDVLNKEDLVRASKGCAAAYYLVHPVIAQNKAYGSADRRSAENMRDAAAESRLQQVIYLGGLGDANHPCMSPHQASRHEVGLILQEGPVPATVLRAAIIIGSGSASFEILRYLAERLPLMIAPRWVYNPTQPIAISTVLEYLEGCLGLLQTFGRSFDIGGPDVLNYKELIALYAREAKLTPRKLLPVPLTIPGLSARWIHLVTPIPSPIALTLTEGLSAPTVCRDNPIETILPVNRLTCQQAIRAALNKILEKQVETCWSDAGALPPPEGAVCGDADYAGGTVLNFSYRTILRAPAERVWKEVEGIGGANGYYFANWLWRLRGRLDKIVGGFGLSRGRRHPTKLKTGDALDFFRVLSVIPDRKLTLMSEMKVPGEALLDLQVVPTDPTTSELRLVSRFLPRGLLGILYWYALYPFHVVVFKGMLRSIAHRAGASGLVRTDTLRLKHQIHCAIVKN